MKPPRSILDKSFVYRPSTHTSLADTFARVRREIEEKKAAEKQEATWRLKNVISARKK